MADAPMYDCNCGAAARYRCNDCGHYACRRCATRGCPLQHSVGSRTLIFVAHDDAQPELNLLLLENMPDGWEARVRDFLTESTPDDLGDTVGPFATRETLFRLVHPAWYRGPAEDGWLNDEIVNDFLELLQLKHPDVHFFSTQFFSWLTFNETGYDYARVRTWTGKRRQAAGTLFDKRLVVVPFHKDQNHWTVAIVDMQHGRILYYDSLSTGNKARQRYVLETLRRYLSDERADKGVSGAAKDFTLDPLLVAPMQKGSEDCGVFILAFITYIAANMSLTFGQGDCAEFRRRILGRLLVAWAKEPSPDVTVVGVVKTVV